eukprot:gene9353-9516_t
MQYAQAFDPDRGYGGSAIKIMYSLQQGADPANTGKMFLPEGSFGNGGAMRIAPVGLVYRNVSMHSLQEAVTAALLCTHVHPLAVEGALTQALAVAELSKQAPPCPASSRGAGGGGTLLRHLQQKLSGSQHGMLGKLELLEQALQGMPSLKGAEQSWQDFLASPVWAQELAVAGQVAPGFQIGAVDAVAASLWAAVCHWHCPEDAVVAAVHYGGDTDTIACMTGALMGALYGSAFIPERWLDGLENSVGPTISDSYFQQAAVAKVLAAGDIKAGEMDNVDIVSTTRNMGRDAATTLCQLLALLDGPPS